MGKAHHGDPCGLKTVILRYQVIDRHSNERLVVYASEPQALEPRAAVGRPLKCSGQPRRGFVFEDEFEFTLREFRFGACSSGWYGNTEFARRK